MNNPEFILLAIFTVWFIFAVVKDAAQSQTAKDSELKADENRVWKVGMNEPRKIEKDEPADLPENADIGGRIDGCGYFVCEYEERRKTVTYEETLLIDEEPAYTESFVLYERFSARLRVSAYQPLPFFYARTRLKT